MNAPYFPLRALICDPHSKTRKRLKEFLVADSFVADIKTASSLKEAIQVLGEHPISAIFIDPLALDLEQASKFIFDVREQIPHIVFCLYMELSESESLGARFYAGPRVRFRHYYKLDKDAADAVFAKAAQEAIFLCLSDVRVFSEVERLKAQRAFYLDTLAPPELQNSLHRFRRHFGNEQKIAFVMMAFGKKKVHDQIYQTIKDALEQFKITAVRADDFEFSVNLRDNVHTYLHGCDFGVAVFERIEDDKPNPNVAYEVGYLTALDKPVCLLREAGQKTVPSDFLGALYVEFDTREHLKKTIKAALREWMARRALGDGKEQDG